MVSAVYVVIVQLVLYFTNAERLHICRQLYIDIIYIIEMPQNTYYSADEYYIDENSADERSSQASDHSSTHEVVRSCNKCRKCRRQSPPPPRPREKCNYCKEPKREKCNKCGKSHRRSEREIRERNSRCERHSKSERRSKSDCKSDCKSECKTDCKYKCEKKQSECIKTEKVIHDDCGKCIVIKIRPCK